MLQQHVDKGADVTVGCLEMPRSESSSFGIIDVDENDVIGSFLEKPADPPAMPGKPDKSLASMGIYIFARGAAQLMEGCRDRGRLLVGEHRSH
jgi:glucose-1-phosphate adenylyltransferase